MDFLTFVAAIVLYFRSAINKVGIDWDGGGGAAYSLKVRNLLSVVFL